MTKIDLPSDYNSESIETIYKDTVLVIGTKPGSFLPNIKPKKIYTANMGIERSIFYKQKNLNTKIISVVGNGFFNFRDYINKLKHSHPNELVTTNGKINLKEFFDTDFINEIKYRYIENKGKDLQRKYFNSIIFRLADMGLIFTNKNKLFGILRYVYNILIKQRPPMGFTTGCLTVLLALIENNTYKVIVTGIGLKGGKHHHQSNRSYPDYRGWADAYLMKRLPASLKSRLITTDLNFSKIVGVKLLENDIK